MNTMKSLREALHREIDRLFDEHESSSGPGEDTLRPSNGEREFRLSTAGSARPFSHTWPDTTSERYRGGTRYVLHVGARRHRFLVGWTRRDAFGRKRERIVVFRETGPSGGASLYAVTEFVETDDGTFAALIPRPEQPRAALRDGDPVPPWCRDHRVARTDTLFDDVRKGPSLRLIVAEADEPTMVTHAYHVARLRGRLSLL